MGGRRDEEHVLKHVFLFVKTGAVRTAVGVLGPRQAHAATDGE